MEFIKTLIPLLLTASLAGLVLAVGLNSRPGDLFYVLKRPSLLGRAVLAVLLIPPLLAAGILWLLPLSGPVKAGIMLMAVAPVPPLVPGKQLGVGGRRDYAYGLYNAMALLTVISVPLVFDLTARLYGRHDVEPFAAIARTVLTGVLAPLALGILVRWRAPAFAAKAAPWAYRLSMVLIVLAFAPILASLWPAMAHLVGNGTLAAMAALTLGCIGVGHLLGGPTLSDRATLAVTASVRHPGIAMALASAHFSNPQVTAAVLLFMLVGLAVSLPYTVWIKRRARTAHD